jgi:hypothetical protein
MSQTQPLIKAAIKISLAIDRTNNSLKALGFQPAANSLSSKLEEALRLVLEGLGVEQEEMESVATLLRYSTEAEFSKLLTKKLADKK